MLVVANLVRSRKKEVEACRISVLINFSRFVERNGNRDGVLGIAKFGSEVYFWGILVCQLNIQTREEAIFGCFYDLF